MATMTFDTTENTATGLDAKDPLRALRDEFLIPRQDDKELVYLCGNSLGLQPKRTRVLLDEVLDDWAKLGVEGHVQARLAWMPFHEFLTDSLAKIVGAKPTEVVPMSSLTLNLHLMMVSFYRPEGKRYKIVIEKNAFPSDIYATKSQLAYHGYDPDSLIFASPSDGSDTISIEDIKHLIKENEGEIALFMMSGVNYYTGQAFDIKQITELAHAAGAVVGWDLAHATGNLLLQLHDWEVDFAAWCSYKYLNGGPGSTAGLFVHEKHHGKELPRFAGWWGHNKDTRFLMPDTFDPIPTAESWQMSNPPILPLAALLASLQVFDKTSMKELRTKSDHLTAYLETQLEAIPSDRISLITPHDPKQRGAQLSIRIDGADKSVFDKVSAQHMTVDWREPDTIRVAPAPLYNTYHDCWKFAQALKNSL